MSGADNGQPVSQRGNYTGSKIAPKRKAQIIALLGAGETVMEIARQTRACRNVIMAIRSANYNEIQHRKDLFAAAALRLAFSAAEQIQAHLDEGNLSTQQLVQIVGVLVDKALALGRDAAPRIAFDHFQHIPHAHITEHTWNETLAEAAGRDRRPTQLLQLEDTHRE